MHIVSFPVSYFLFPVSSFLLPMNLSNLTIKQTHDGLIAKDFSCTELTQATLRHIATRNKDVNAFITVTDDLALAQAKIVDARIAAGEPIRALEGVPCAVKDNILIEDIRATGGSQILKNYIATYDATVITRLKNEGVVFVGKTNMDEFAMGGSGENSAYAPTKNPRDLNMVPGGSSSGSTAAVADDQCVFALGTDTGGSIRQPASFCGIVGMKPTYGRVSRHGAMAMASSLDQIGPLTKNVEDAALVLKTIAGHDGFDTTVVNREDDWMTELERGVAGKKIGVPREYFVSGMDPDVESSVRLMLKKLEEQGATLVDIHLPHTPYALATYYIIMPAEVSSNVARYDGVRYGWRAKAGNLEEMYLNTRQEGFGEEVQRRIMLGTFVLSSGYYDAYYKKAQQVRTLIKRDFDKAFAEVDCILTPTAPTPAFPLGDKTADPMTMYLADIYTVSANLAGIPGMSVPCGKKGNLPIGIQVLARPFDESNMLRVARAIEREMSSK